MAAFDEGILSVSKPEKCGCEELLTKINPVYQGWLRRRCLRNALHIKFIKWPQQYVIIGEKCLYYFSNEISKHPEGAVSLYGFNKVIRASDVKSSEATWAFKLEHIQPHIKSIYFAASSEREMVFWMKALKAEMLIANNMEKKFKVRGSSSENSDSSWDSADYKVLEESIYMEPVGSRISHFVEKDDVSDSDEEQHNEKPPLPPRSSFIRARDPEGVFDNSKKLSSGYSFYPKNTLSEKIKPGENRPEQQAAPEARGDSYSYWQSVFFHGTKTKAAEVISRIAENGVYLIRNSEDESKVLLFYSHTGIKKFRIIAKENGKVSLTNNGPDFEAIEDLLYYYYENDLPYVNLKLVTPYKLHSHYKE